MCVLVAGLDGRRGRPERRLCRAGADCGPGVRHRPVVWFRRACRALPRQAAGREQSMVAGKGSQAVGMGGYGRQSHLARLMHRAQAPDQRFRVWPRCRRSGLSGIVLGTYSAAAPAALCSVARHVRPLRCGFATEDCGAEALHGACPVQPYAAALLSSTPWPAGCMELTWRSRILASEVRSLTQLPGSAPGSAPAKAAAIRSR